MHVVVSAGVGGATAAILTVFWMTVLHREPPSLVVAVLSVGAAMAASYGWRTRAAKASDA